MNRLIDLVLVLFLVPICSLGVAAVLLNAIAGFDEIAGNTWLSTAIFALGIATAVVSVIGLRRGVADIATPAKAAAGFAFLALFMGMMWRIVGPEFGGLQQTSPIVQTLAGIYSALPTMVLVMTAVAFAYIVALYAGHWAQTRRSAPVNRDRA